MTSSHHTRGWLNDVCSFPQSASAAAVGIDLDLAPEVRDSLAHLGDRYRRRVFTGREYDENTSSTDPVPPAARFVAEEPTLKALKTEGAQPEQASMEVWHHLRGRCGKVNLTGSAARWERLRSVAEATRETGP